MSIGRRRRSGPSRCSPVPGFALTLTNQLASVYSVLSRAGIDATVIVSKENVWLKERMRSRTLDALRAYGIRWMLAHRVIEEPVTSENPEQWRLELMPSDALETVRMTHSVAWSNGDITVYELRDVDPLAFALSYPRKPLPITFNGRGARVRVSGLTKGGQVVVNVLRRPWFVALADGRRIPLKADEWHRVVVRVPSGTKILEVNYNLCWGLGIPCGLVLAAPRFLAR